MHNVANLEQAILDNVRQLPLEKQQEVLDFAEFLRQKLISPSPAAVPSLQQMAAIPLEERHKLLTPLMPATAHDFLTDPALTEFSILDSEDWESEDD